MAVPSASVERSQRETGCSGFDRKYVDKLDTDETSQQLAVVSALARQNREVCIPEIDGYVYGVVADKAGYQPVAVELTADRQRLFGDSCSV